MIIFTMEKHIKANYVYIVNFEFEFEPHFSYSKSLPAYDYDKMVKLLVKNHSSIFCTLVSLYPSTSIPDNVRLGGGADEN